jgi:hypothetical protein
MNLSFKSNSFSKKSIQRRTIFEKIDVQIYFIIWKQTKKSEVSDDFVEIRFRFLFWTAQPAPVDAIRAKKLIKTFPFLVERAFGGQRIDLLLM